MIHFFCFTPHAADQMNFNILKLYIGPLILDSVELLDTVEPRLTTTPFIRPPRYYGHILSNQT